MSQNKDKDLAVEFRKFDFSENQKTKQEAPKDPCECPDVGNKLSDGEESNATCKREGVFCPWRDYYNNFRECLFYRRNHREEFE